MTAKMYSVDFDPKNSDTDSVSCFLCDSSHLHSRYKNHLLLDHGVLNNVEFLVKVSLYKETNSSLPPLIDPEAGPIPKPTLTNSSSQTESRIDKEVAWPMYGVEETVEALEEKVSEEEQTITFTCRLCDKDLKHIHEVLTQHMEEVHLISWQEYLVRMQQFEESPLSTSDMFFCSICNKRVEMKKTEHLIKQHNMEDEVYDAMEAPGKMGDKVEGSSTCDVCGRVCLDLARHLRISHKMSREDYIANSDVGRKQVKVYNKKDSTSEGEGTTLPTDMRCYFDCGEVFKKDYQLKLHLKLKHSQEDPDEMKRAEWAAQKEMELTRRSGTRLQCALCPVVLSCKSALWSHVTFKHNITYQDYKAEHGTGKPDEQAVFQCKICQRTIKHEPSNVSKHLEGVHGITWTHYVALVRGEGAGLDRLPVIELVQCKVCGNTVKYLQPHLKNIHNINMDEYKYYVDNGGEVSLPEIALVKCEICGSNVKFFKNHLKRTHHITEKEYEEIMANEKTLPPIETVMCEICRAKVKDLPRHLSRNHRINMAEYNELIANKVYKEKDKVEIRSLLDDHNFDESCEDISTRDAKYIPERLSSSKNRSSPKSLMVSAVKPSKAEIQDKANTRCSSCQVEQGSRKRFLRHCLMVHKIKIKTRPSLAVPPPPSEAGFRTSLEDPVSKNRESESSFLVNGLCEKRGTSSDPPSMDESEIRRVKCKKGKVSVPCNQSNNNNTETVEGGVPCNGCEETIINNTSIKRHPTCSLDLQDK